MFALSYVPEMYLVVSSSVKPEVSKISATDEDKGFKCKACEKQYYYRKGLWQHAIKAHPRQLNEILPRRRNNEPSSYTYTCKFCDKKFCFKRSVNRHQRDVHKEPSAITHKLKCVLCTYQTSSKKCWLSHLETAHEIHVKSEDLKFSTEEEFIKWKAETERTTHSKFVKQNGPVIVGDTSRHNYICHRSGYFVSESAGIRRLKSTGSVKINGKCPAAMKAIVCKDGTWQVHFVSTHVGHEVGSAQLQNVEMSGISTINEKEEILDQSNRNGCSNASVSLSEKKQKIISMFSDIVGRMTASEVNLAEKVVSSLNALLGTVGVQNNTSFRKSGESQKRKSVPERKLFTKKKIAPHCSLAVPYVHETNEILGKRVDEGDNTNQVVAVEQDVAMPWLQYSAIDFNTENSVAAEHNYAMPLQPQLQHDKPA